MGRGYHLIFQSDRFNVSQPKEYFINPCCFGEDAAAWLRDRLADFKIGATEAEQEDWGWYIYVFHQENRYFIGVTGHAVDESSGNRGEWRFMIGKRRSLREMITGKKRMLESEEIIGILRRIIDAQPDMKGLRMEAHRVITC